MEDKKEFTVWLAEDGLESAQKIRAAGHESAAEEWAEGYDQHDRLSRNEGDTVRIIVDGDGASRVFDVSACIVTRYDVEEIT